MTTPAVTLARAEIGTMNDLHAVQRRHGEGAAIAQALGLLAGCAIFLGRVQKCDPAEVLYRAADERAAKMIGTKSERWPFTEFP